MASSLRTAVFGVAVLLAPVCGCGAEGYSPDCTDNVSTNGIGLANDGCEQFGSCWVDDKGNVCTPSDNPADPFADCPNAKEITGADAIAKTCCKDEKGQPMTGYALELCLYGFGAVDVNAGTPGK